MSQTSESAPPPLTPGQILERMKARIADLEAQLEEARSSGPERRRLQDLSPDELAIEAAGAAADIIKAARSQAADLRQAADADAGRARDAAHQALVHARAQAERMVAEAEAARDSMLSDARENSTAIMARVRQEADDITAQARAESDEIRQLANKESDKLIDEAQRRLQTALIAAEQSTSTANEEARRIVNAARSTADSLREDARKDARAAITECLAQLKIQEDAMSDMLDQAAGLRASMGAVLDGIRTAGDAMAAESARSEAATRSYLATLAQLKSDLQSRVGPAESPD